MFDWLKAVKNLALTSKEKAFVGGVVAAISAFLVQNGLSVNDLWNAQNLWALVIFAITHQAVFWTSNSK